MGKAARLAFTVDADADEAQVGKIFVQSCGECAGDGGARTAWETNFPCGKQMFRVRNNMFRLRNKMFRLRNKCSVQETNVPSGKQEIFGNILFNTLN